MKITADEHDLAFAQTPRFQRADVHARLLNHLSAAVAGTVVLLLIGARSLSAYYADPIWREVLLVSAAALCVLLAGLRSAAWVCAARKTALKPGAAPRMLEPDADSKERPAWERRLMRALQIAATKIIAAVRSEELEVCALSLLSLLLVRLEWDLTGSGAVLGLPRFVGSGLLLAGTFCLLVLERYFDGRDRSEWPEARWLAQLLRVIILVLLLEALALLFTAESRLWPVRLAVLAGILPAVLGFEFLCRAIFAAITRAPGAAEPKFLADSLLARLMVWPPRPFEAMHAQLHDRFGIDLRQNWAFSFIRRMSLPVLGVIVLVGWILTGAREVPLASREIYERFGKPAAVWDPGLHVGLPWPLARTLRVENGVVHQLSASLSADSQPADDRTDADAPAPAGADRLWDVSHVAENAQVISSENNAKQSFQIVNMDVRFVYRIGLSDAAVMAVTYHCSDVDALIRSTASRVMVLYFASRTLDGLLGEQRDALAGDIKRAVQRELDAFDSGVELMSVLVESIHPPAGAAAAYHAVQAAQISAQAIVAQERGAAAATVNDAQTEAIRLEGSATASAREQVAEAEVGKLGFDADREGYAAAGPAFVSERYFSQLAVGLSKANLIIIDHRISGAAEAPAIDLRSFAPAGGYPR
jgi:regulator of protease activity HflC (stomatin/prohibitin superfamily)